MHAPCAPRALRRNRLAYRGRRRTGRSRSSARISRCAWFLLKRDGCPDYSRKPCWTSAAHARACSTGLISDCGKFSAEKGAAEGWYEVSTLVGYALARSWPGFGIASDLYTWRNNEQTSRSTRTTDR